VTWFDSWPWLLILWWNCGDWDGWEEMELVMDVGVNLGEDRAEEARWFHGVLIADLGLVVSD
jgi:hypothetical protein